MMQPHATGNVPGSSADALADIFGDLGMLGGGSSNSAGGMGGLFGNAPVNTALMLPKEMWIPANRGKGMEVQGTICRRVGGQICMEMTITNKALQVREEN